MYIGGGIKRSGDFLQDAQGHQSSFTPPTNIPGESVMWRFLKSDLDQTRINLIKD